MNIYHIFLFLLLFSATLSLIFIIYAWQYRLTRGAPAFIVSLIGQCIWSTGYMFELHTSSLASAIFWDNIQFIGTDFVTVGITLFTLAYTHNDEWYQRSRPLLAIHPILNVLFVWTDPVHSMVRPVAWMETSGYFPVLTYEYGPWMWFTTEYYFLLVILALGVLVVHLLRTPRYHKLQIAIVLLAMSIPLIGAIVTVSGLVPLKGMEKLDISPISYALANPLIAWALFHKNLLKLMPIARHTLVEHIPDGVLVVDANQHILDVNPAAQTLLQVDANQLIGAPLTTIHADLALVCQTTQSSTNLDLPRQNTPLPPIPIQATVTPLHRHSRLIGWLLVLHDLTEQYKKDAALRHSEEMLRETQHAAHIGGWEIDLQTRALTWTAEMYDLHGVDEHYELSEYSTAVFFPQETHASLRHHYEQLLSKGIPFEVEVPFRPASGQARWVRIIGKPQYQGNTLTRVFGSLQDITAHKATEEALSKAKEAAEAANYAKSLFLSSMSHELRTPLNAILGFAQLLIRDPLLNAHHIEQLDTINRNGNHLLNLINNVLEISRIEAGRIELHPTTCNLHQLLGDIHTLFKMRAKEKGLNLLIEHAADVPRTIEVDEGKLRQVLINLLSNALKFTEQGNVSLMVRRYNAVHDAPFVPRTHESERCLLHISVADTGVGIAENEQQKLFQPFVQSKSGMSSRQGFGLGLAISRQLVELMEGTLQLYSQVGVGSTFTVVLPVTVLAKEVRHPAEDHRFYRLNPELPAPRVLVVDDDTDSLTLLCTLLTHMGFAVHAAGDGQDAIRHWNTCHPDAILMDIRMPGMDGYSTTRQIKTSLHGHATPIIALSAHAFEEDRLNALEAGFDAYIRKPFQVAELCATLTRLLGITFIIEEPVRESARVPHITRLEDVQIDQLIPLIAQIPLDLQQQLRRSAVLGNFQELGERIEQLRAEQSNLAEQLHALADAFQFETIVAAIDQVLDTT